MTRKIAVIGGGIAGLAASYLLSRSHEVSLFERSDRLGGNAYTLTTPGGEEVDIAAAVFGNRSSPNLFRLFRELGIKTVRSFRPTPLDLFGPGIGYHDLDSREGLYFTPRLKGLLAQRFAIFRPDHIAGVLRFMRGLRRAMALLRQGALDGLTVEDALRLLPELRGEAKLLFIGCLCLLTSMHCDAVMAAPAAFLVEKLRRYRDLVPPTPSAILSVRMMQNGTKSYVQGLFRPFRDRTVLNARVRTVQRQAEGVRLCMEDGGQLPFDAVVFACNADQALALLQDPTEVERQLLGAWRYTEGTVVVHTETASFPDRRLMEGYTLLYRRSGRYIDTSVSGALWALPGASRTSTLISTQHPNFPIRDDLRVFEKVFRTPIFDSRSCATTRELPALNGVRHTYYCGSHFGFGLHEDAVTSAFAVARALQAGD
jgi:predicted NAD/FAD-binding protein